MGARLAKEDNTVVVRMMDLKDGQIAQVTDDRYFGTIVQRYVNNAVAIGRQSGFGWSGIESNGLQVRILENDELIRIFDNQ